MNKITRFMNKFSKRTKLVAVVSVLALTAVAAPLAVKAGFGPDRPTKVYTDGVAGFDHVTFNSFTNVPNVGDERAFFTGKYPGGTAFTDPLAEVKDGDVITMQVYVHNNADSSLNDAPGQPGVAKNTKVRVALPTGSAKTQQATAFISADNAQPKVVTDTLDFGAANGGMFELEYVNGSAKVRGNYINAALSDSVVTTGAPIGTDVLNGDLKGCFKELVYVTLQVKVKMPRYSLAKEVRMSGETSKDWTESKNVKAGDKVEWKLNFTNTGATALKAVKIVDQVPAGLTVVPGSVKLINGNYPKGFVFPANAIQDNGRTINVDIGNYDPGINGIVAYETTINKPAAEICTPQKLVNKAFATPQGYGSIWDDANVVVPGNECKPTTQPVYTCDVLTLTRSGDRTVTANVAYTAKNGATLKTVSFNFGDGGKLVTDKTTVNHTYATTGTYAVSAKLLFSVNGKDVADVTSIECAKNISFTATPPPVTPPVTPPVLPKTGAGSTVVIFAAVAAIATTGHYIVRRLMAR